MGLFDAAVSSIPVVGSIYAGARGEEMQRKAAAAQRRAAEKGVLEQRAAYTDIGGLLDPYSQAGQMSMQQLLGMNSPTLGDFEYGGTVDQFMAPDVAMQQQAGREAIGQGFGARGALNTSAALNAMQRNAAQIQAQAYSDAYQRQQADKANAYEQYLNKFRSAYQASADRRATLSDVMGQGYGATGTLANARLGTAGNVANLYGNIGNANASSATAGMNSLAGGQAAGGQLLQIAGLGQNMGWWGK